MPGLELREMVRKLKENERVGVKKKENEMLH